MKSPLRVVKIGGSLCGLNTLASLLKVISEAPAPLVVVPGGGSFADTVRTEQLRHGYSDFAAHRMALLAMAQYGMMLADLAPVPWTMAWGESAVRIDLAAGGNRPVLWLPHPLSDAAELKASWNVTSDSLALWLAERLDADRLVLVKSCAAPERGALQDLAAAGIIDPEIEALAARSPGIALDIVYDGDPQAMLSTLGRVHSSRT